MDIKGLRQVLKRAERLFSGAVATKQASALKELDDALGKADQAKQVTDYVQEANARSDTSTGAASSSIVDRLSDKDLSQSDFDALIAAMSTNRFRKSDAVAVACAYTGMRPSAFRSKGDALRAIKDTFQQRTYLSAKAKLNEKVTPW